MEKIINTWFIFVFLLGLTVIRFIMPDEKSDWISLISYIGVLIALSDIYTKLNKLYGNNDNFSSFRGLFIIIGTILFVILVLIWCQIIKISTKWNDILSLLALLISLPRDLYITLMDKYIKKHERRNLQDEYYDYGKLEGKN